PEPKGGRAMGGRYNWHKSNRGQMRLFALYLNGGRLILAVGDGELCRAAVIRGREELPAALADYAARHHRGAGRVVEVGWALYGGAGELASGRHAFTPGGAPE